MTSNNKQLQTMDQLADHYSASLVPFRKGDIIEAKVISVHANQVLIDINGIYSGIVPERELSVDYKELKPGDKTLVYIMNMENRDGKAILSLKRADQERISRALKDSYQDESADAVPVKVKEANRGGLIVAYGETDGFLPVSQLNPEHYPRVGSENKDQIQSKLSQLIGKTLSAKVITFEPHLNKIIFSERAAGGNDQEELLKKYKVGQHLDGKISGIVDFGIFVDIGDIEGLVHISELSWDRVEDIGKMFKEGQKVKVEVIAIENGKISLSVKRLEEDPWIQNAKKYKKDQKVKGTVVKITPFGAFVKIDSAIEGLVHISEIINKEGKKVANPNEVLESQKKYDFKVLSVEPETHKFSLTMRIEDEKDEKKDEKEKKPAKKKEKDSKKKAISRKPKKKTIKTKSAAKKNISKKTATNKATKK